jgi:AcrR family transcriptional regulator
MGSHIRPIGYEGHVPTSAQASRQARERELVEATRALFDERGMGEAPIDEIARSVGIARGLIYRQFSSKEELFVLTITEYLAELAELIETAVAEQGGPEERLARCTEAFAGYCQRYPAYLDCQMALMRRPARELRDTVSESVFLRLGQGMASCLGPLADLLRRGAEQGAFDVEDPDFTANLLWTQMTGAMHLVRIRVGVREAAPGVPGLFRVRPEQVVESCVQTVLATVRAAGSGTS